MDDLTPRQQSVLTFIRNHIAELGLPPSRAEIAAEFKFRSPRSAQKYIEVLARKGALSWRAGVARGLSLTEESGLPLIGRVAAGAPLLAEEHVVGRYAVESKLFTPRADYLLAVRGQSMRDAGILDGDWLAVHRTARARSGDIVVARIHDEVTVKRLRMKTHSAELLPANADFAPIVVDLRREELAIEGLAVGVVRRWKRQ